jgi:hypothetical protein
MATDRSWRYDQVGRPLDDVISDLHDRIVELEEYVNWDMEMRQQNPALQDIYEKYQITRLLLGNGTDDSQ